MKALKKNHLASCPMTIISCPYVQMGCTAKVQCRDVESHLQSSVRLHLDLACVKLNNTQEELKRTTRKLEQKIDVLENKILQYSEEQNYTWKIKGFSEVLRQAKNGVKPIIKSAPFYRYGYKHTLRLDPNGAGPGENTHLSIFSALMKGENDATLHWPYNKMVTFTLVDQQEDPNEKKDIVRTFTANVESEKCFARPVTNENSGRGFFNFVPHNKLSERRYIVDDTLFIQVQYTTPQWA